MNNNGRYEDDGPARIRADLEAATAVPQERQRQRPTITLGDDEIRDQVAVCLAELKTANGAEPYLFSRSKEKVVRLVPDEDEDGITHELLNRDGLRAELVEHVDFIRRTAKREHPAHPPDALISTLRGQRSWPLPRLDGIARCPFFTEQGDLVEKPGYHAKARFYLYLDASLRGMLPVPDRPTAVDVANAVRILLSPIRDFPFDSDASRAAALALGLVPYVRRLISGPIPIHAFDAPVDRTGKGLLIKTELAPALGYKQKAMPDLEDKRNRDEVRKRITAAIIENAFAIWFDNINTFVKGAALATLITEEWWDRILGSSQTTESLGKHLRPLTVIAGNNLYLDREILFRAIRCRLNANMERPGERQFGFDPVEHALAIRTELVWANLVLVRHWLHLGRPGPKADTKVLGGFDAWKAVIGGILYAAGIPGFLENLSSFQNEQLADSDTEQWRPTVGAWWAAHGLRCVTPSDLCALPGNPLAVAFPKEKDQDDGSYKKSLGWRLRKLADRTFDLQLGGQNIVSLQIKRAAYQRKGHGPRDGWALEVVNVVGPAADTEVKKAKAEAEAATEAEANPQGNLYDDDIL